MSDLDVPCFPNFGRCHTRHASTCDGVGIVVSGARPYGALLVSILNFAHRILSLDSNGSFSFDTSHRKSFFIVLTGFNGAYTGNPAQ